MENNYYWIKYGNDWYIAIKDHDEEQEKTCWYVNGMEITKEPDEVGSLIVRGKETLDEPPASNCIKPAVNACFTSREQLRTFIQMHIPIAVKPKKPAKTMFVSAFRSANAENIVIDMLTDAFLNRL